MGTRENKFKRVLSKSFKTDPNKVKIASNNTYPHEIIKAAVSTILIQRNHEIVTESIFETGGRADIFDLSTGVVYEILHSENLKDFELKKNKYPAEVVELVPIHTKDYLLFDIIKLKVELEKKLY